MLNFSFREYHTTKSMPTNNMHFKMKNPTKIYAILLILILKTNKSLAHVCTGPSDGIPIPADSPGHCAINCQHSFDCLSYKFEVTENIQFFYIGINYVSL